ncbi:MAG: hypothetical protein QM726_09240 [Chitinophagaceae bacterium]
MKKMITIAVAVMITLGAAAQRGGHFIGGGTRVIVGGPSFGWGVGAYYDPFLYPFGYPYGYYGHVPTKLDMQVQDIKNDYSDKIASAKDDKSLNKQERKQTVNDLKHERDKAINDAKANYYKS